jgi:hypothetical protein
MRGGFSGLNGGARREAERDATVLRLEDPKGVRCESFLEGYRRDRGASNAWFDPRLSRSYQK